MLLLIAIVTKNSNILLLLEICAAEIVIVLQLLAANITYARTMVLVIEAIMNKKLASVLQATPDSHVRVG